MISGFCSETATHDTAVQRLLPRTDRSGRVPGDVARRGSAKAAKPLLSFLLGVSRGWLRDWRRSSGEGESGEEVKTMSAWVPCSLVVPMRERVEGGG